MLSDKICFIMPCWELHKIDYMLRAKLQISLLYLDLIPGIITKSSEMFSVNYFN